MAFNIRLIKNMSSPETLDKDLTDIVTLTGTLKATTSILDPVIVMEVPLADIVECNYMRIPQFGRWYYVTNIKSVTKDLVEISGHVDVLRTYRDQIRENRGIVRRSEKNYNLDLNDGSLKVYQNPQVTTKSFPQGFTTSIEFVLAVAGS